MIDLPVLRVGNGTSLNAAPSPLNIMTTTATGTLWLFA